MRGHPRSRTSGRGSGTGSGLRRALGWTVRLGLAGGCLLWALWGIDVPAALDAVSAYEPARVLGVLAVSALGYLGMTARLGSLLAAEAPPLRTALVASLFGLGMNNVLPARLGELAKIVYLRRHAGTSLGTLLWGVFWERFADVHALLALTAVALLVADLHMAAWPLLGAVGAVWIVLALVRRRPHWLSVAAERIPSRRLTEALLGLREHMEAPVRARGVVALAGWTTFIWLVYIAQIGLCLIWVAGMPLGLEAVLVTFVLSALGMTLPVSPGALGVFEAAVVLALGWYGVGRELALPAALLAHAVQFLPTTAVAVVVAARAPDLLRATRSARPAKA